MSKRETSAEIDETAAHWALRIDEAGLDEDAQAAFNLWLEGDMRRVGAFARAQAVLVHVKRAKALGSDFEPMSFNDKVTPVEPVADLPQRTGLTRRKMLIGASAIAATGAFAILLPIKRVSARLYETGRGETRRIPLEDGSTVTLNTDSRIAVTINAASRTVQLVQGEALFKVVATNRAPFLVEIGDTALRARDATFSVCQLDALPLEVKVCAGNVELERDTKGKRLLHANMQAIMPANGAVIERSITPETLARTLAWQEGMLSFEDTPLRQAAEEFARYSDRKIEITDPMVGAETVTGRYAANNPEGFARAVALSLNLHMQSTVGGIVITR